MVTSFFFVPSKGDLGRDIWGILVLITIQLVCVFSVQGQTFTRITDPNNPVVTEQLETGGATWIDINNDGYPDLYVANGNLTYQKNSLFINDKKGGFVQVRTGGIVNDTGSSIGSTWGDYNGDGIPEVFVTHRNNIGNFLYRGGHDSVFIKVLTGNVVTDIANSNSSSWVDIDGDGDLDLYVVNFQGNDFLYINSGSPNFDLAPNTTASIVQDGALFSISASWADYNNDRKPDLFEGNAGTQNDVIYTNNGNLQFTKTTLADGKSSVGSSWGDYDNDGYFDLFVTNTTGQKSVLYHNGGPPNFILTPVDTGIVSNDPGNAVGSGWGDYDNDGDLDLFVGNDGGSNFLYRNDGPPSYSFTKISTGAIVNDGGNSFGVVWGDYDRDGALDLFVANRLNQNNFLYHNDGNANAWVEVKCVGGNFNRSGLGAKVRVKATINGVPRWQMREVLAQCGYNSQNMDIHFGLGNATVIDSIRVEWQNGTTTIFTGLQVKKIYTVNENGSISGVHPERISSPTAFQLSQNFPNPFNPSTHLRFSITEPVHVSLKVFDVLGKEVSTLVDEMKAAGSYEVEFDASRLSSGIYFYTLAAGQYRAAKRMALTR